MHDEPSYPQSNSIYRDGLAAGVLKYQRCTTCGQSQTLARYACQRCAGSRLVWCDASGAGVVHAVTVVLRAPSDEFRALVPYTLVLVDLEEGFRIMAHGEPGLSIGDAVQAGPLKHADNALAIFHRTDMSDTGRHP